MSALVPAAFTELPSTPTTPPANVVTAAVAHLHDVQRPEVPPPDLHNASDPVTNDGRETDTANPLEQLWLAAERLLTYAAGDGSHSTIPAAVEVVRVAVAAVRDMPRGGDWYPLTGAALQVAYDMSRYAQWVQVGNALDPGAMKRYRRRLRTLVGKLSVEASQCGTFPATLPIAASCNIPPPLGMQTDPTPTKQPTGAKSAVSTPTKGTTLAGHGIGGHSVGKRGRNCIDELEVQERQAVFWKRYKKGSPIELLASECGLSKPQAVRAISRHRTQHRRAAKK